MVELSLPIESDRRDGQWGTEVVFAMLAAEWREATGKAGVTAHA